MSDQSDGIAVYCRLLTLALAGGIAYGALSAIRKIDRFRHKVKELVTKSPYYHMGELGAPSAAYLTSQPSTYVEVMSQQIKQDESENTGMKKESFNRSNLFAWERPLYDLLSSDDILLVASIPVGIWSAYALAKAVHNFVEKVYANKLVEK